jgi:hypothetical protein
MQSESLDVHGRRLSDGDALATESGSSVGRHENGCRYTLRIWTCTRLRDVPRVNYA